MNWKQFFSEQGKAKRNAGRADQIKAKPSAVPWSLRLVQLGASLGCVVPGYLKKGALGALCPWHRLCSSGLSSPTSPGFLVWCKFSGCSSWLLPGSWTGWFNNYLQSYTPHDWKISHKILITVLSRAGTFIAYYGNGSTDKTHYLWSLKLSSICGKILFAFSVAGIPPKGYVLGAKSNTEKKLGPRAWFFFPSLRCWHTVLLQSARSSHVSVSPADKLQ